MCIRDRDGSTTLNANVTATGAIQFNDAVNLTHDVTLASTNAGDIGFAKTVDGADNLIVNTAGTTTFSGVVGGTTQLTSLMTDMNGFIALNANVTTTGAIQFNDQVNLTHDVTLTSTNAGSIGFAKTVDGADNLVVNTTGITTFSGVVGGTTALTSLTTDMGGFTTLNANVSTTGAIQFNDVVNLTHDVTLTSTNAGNIRFAKTVDGADNLIVNTAGITTFGGVVGGTTQLTSVTTDMPGSTTLNADVTTTGVIQFNDAVNLIHDVTLASTSAGNIEFAKTIDGAENLIINTAGITTFSGVVGGTTQLTSITTDMPGSTTLNANITTTGAIQFNDAVNLTQDVTLTSSNAGSIGFAKTVDGANNLIVNTAVSYTHLTLPTNREV